MQTFSNIEKSGFHRGEYVGYAEGRVFRIRKSTGSYGNWYAYEPANDRTPHINAWTLASMSMKLRDLH